jgi:hypothetical protein
MATFRSIALTSICVVALPATAALRATADNPTLVPVVRLTGHVSPNSNRLPKGTPLALTLDTRFGSVPAGGDFVLQRQVYLFPHGAVVNGRLFPSCSAAKLARAHGRLGACPKGSRIGAGVATGTAVALGITSAAKITLFNGPRGRSITVNVHITSPALIDATIAAPLTTLRGHYANKLTVTLPDSLQHVLGSDIVASDVRVTTGATRVVHGVRRGYIEVVRCPRSGRARIHGIFSFEQGAVAQADATVAC